MYIEYILNNNDGQFVGVLWEPIDNSCIITWTKYNSFIKKIIFFIHFKKVYNSICTLAHIWTNGHKKLLVFFFKKKKKKGEIII